MKVFFLLRSRWIQIKKCWEPHNKYSLITCKCAGSLSLVASVSELLKLEMRPWESVLALRALCHWRVAVSSTYTVIHWKTLANCVMTHASRWMGNRGRNTFLARCFYFAVYPVWLETSHRSVAQSCPTLCNPMDCSTPGFPVLHHLPELVQTRVHWISDAIQPSHPLLSPSPPAFSLSQHQGLFQWVSSLQPKYWNFSFNISPSNEHSGLTSFRMDWLDLLAVQGTLKSLQNHSSKASVL